MKTFFDYCEANYQAMESDKEKVGTVLEIFTAARASVARGGATAKKQLLGIELQMTPDQIVAAKKAAKEISARLAKLGEKYDATDGKRSRVTPFVSDDVGVTWKGGLLLDERESSYPDGVQAEDGTLFIIYDHQRYTLNRAGKPVTDKVRLQRVETQLQNTDDPSGAPGK